jgi:isopentenyl-diphosphate delta-isomerase
LLADDPFQLAGEPAIGFISEMSVRQIGPRIVRVDHSSGQRDLGNLFWDWGIPTAASVMAVSSGAFRTIFATGGMTNGLEVAKAILLGAHVVGIARPVLQAYDRGGAEGAAAYLRAVEEQLRTAMLLVGATNLRQLREAPRFIDGRLEQWQRMWQTHVAR